ncbi:hypothetical protein MPER_04940, partial [Moniliophthora perniciosa FA553]
MPTSAVSGPEKSPLTITDASTPPTTTAKITEQWMRMGRSVILSLTENSLVLLSVPTGNHPLPDKGPVKSIDDSSTVKMVFALGPASFGSDYYRDAFANQAVGIAERVRLDCEDDEEAGRSWLAFKYPYKRVQSSMMEAPDVLLFHTERLFEIPPEKRVGQRKPNPDAKASKLEKVDLKRPRTSGSTPTTPKAKQPSASTSIDSAGSSSTPL